jgi:hypothetical protein
LSLIIVFHLVKGIEQLYALEVFAGGISLDIELEIPLLGLFQRLNQLK